MTYIKIGDQMYLATIRGFVRDTDWNNRDSKAITLEMTYEEALATFVDGLEWFIVYQNDEETQVYDNSDYCVAGAITDNRNSTVTVKMGKITDAEALAELMEVLGE